MTKNREPLISLALYHAFKWSVVSPFLYTYLRGQVSGAEHVPKDGAFMVVSNHGSNFDPVLLSCAVERPVAYMAKEELFKIPVLKTAIALYGAYPVKRGSADRQAIRSALDYLSQGWGVGLFVSGTRTADGKIADPKAGAAMIAAKAQVPVLPVCLWGTHLIEEKGKKLPNSVPITIRIGEILPPPSSTKREELDRSTQAWTEIINQMHDLGR
jgi:1-acyl-sn-glycerol-3-phosphate acyltransferase